eukprot:gene7173-11485_t
MEEDIFSINLNKPNSQQVYIPIQDTILEEDLQNISVEEIEKKIGKINFDIEKEIDSSNKKYVILKKSYLEEIQKFVEGKKDNYPKVHSFWLKVLKNSYLFYQKYQSHLTISKEDELSLNYLQKVTLKEEVTETNEIFTLDFHFEKGNSYFMNEKLTKVFSKKLYKDFNTMDENTQLKYGLYTSKELKEYMINIDDSKIQGTKILWKDGKKLQTRISMTNRSTKINTEVKDNIQKTQSFYNFFDEVNDNDESVQKEQWSILYGLKKEILQDPLFYYLRLNEYDFISEEEDSYDFDDEFITKDQSEMMNDVGYLRQQKK